MRLTWLPLAVTMTLAPVPLHAATLVAASFSGLPELSAAEGTLANTVALLGPAVDGAVPGLVGATLLSTDVAALAATPANGAGAGLAYLETFGDLLVDNRGNAARLDLELTLSFDLRAEGSGIFYEARAAVAFLLGLGSDPAGPLVPIAEVSAAARETRDAGTPSVEPDIEGFAQVISVSVPGGAVAVGSLSASVRSSVFAEAFATANTDARLTLTAARLVAPETLPPAEVPLPASVALLATALGALALRRRVAGRQGVVPRGTRLRAAAGGRLEKRDGAG